MKYIIMGSALSIAGKHYPEGSIVDSSGVDITGVEQYLHPVPADTDSSTKVSTPDTAGAGAGDDADTDSSTKNKKGGK